MNLSEAPLLKKMAGLESNNNYVKKIIETDTTGIEDILDRMDNRLKIVRENFSEKFKKLSNKSNSNKHHKHKLSF